MIAELVAVLLTASAQDVEPESLAGPARIRWKRNVGAGSAGVVVRGDRLYTAGNAEGSDAVVCLEAASGKELWRHAYRCAAGEPEGPRSLPALDGTNVYTLSREGQAFCLDAATGEVRWEIHLVRDFRAVAPRWGFAGSPRVAGDRVIYNARGHGLAVEKGSGKKAWVGAPGEAGYASPVLLDVEGKRRVAVFGAAALTLVDPASGEPAGAFAWETKYGANAADPRVVDGKLFISSGYERGCALLDVSGPVPKSLWENKNLRAYVASPLCIDGFLYGIDGSPGSGRLVCLDPKTGEPRWIQRTERFESLTAAGNRLLTMDSAGKLRLIEANPKGYRQLASMEVLPGRTQNWTAPLLSGGAVYCRNGSGDVVCIELMK